MDFIEERIMGNIYTIIVHCINSEKLLIECNFICRSEGRTVIEYTSNRFRNLSLFNNLKKHNILYQTLRDIARSKSRVISYRYNYLQLYSVEFPFELI